MTDLDLDAIEARAKVASAGRLNWQGIDALRSLVESDVPALVAALRDARAKVGLWEADFPCDEGCRDYPEETCSRHGRRPADLWERVEFFARERDDWRRRYEALRDGVTGLCDEAERRADPGVRLWSMPEARVKTSELRAVVARVEGDES